MNDQHTVEYLRSRGRVEPPLELTRSVMTAIDAAPAGRSWFSAYLPAFVAAGAIVVIAVLAVLIGPGPDVGPGPSPSVTATPATLQELETAVTAAVDELADAGGVRGTHLYSIEHHLASATWFDWRPNGDQVVVERQDIDVSAPWWTEPEGQPLSVGERISTTIEVISEGHWYVAREEGWLAPLDLPRGPLTWGIGVLAGEIPTIGGFPPNADIVVSRHHLEDGGEVWVLEFERDGREAIVEWSIDDQGRLISYAVQGAGVAMTPGVDLGTASTRAVVEFTPLDDPELIPTPDIDAVPDPARFGLPPDFPLGTSSEATIDDLGVALLDAVDVLRAAPGVEGRQEAEIDGTIGSATWFDWRPNGDQVIVQRQDLDVTETGWWIEPDGAPPATGQHIYTNIQVTIGDELFFTDEAGDWQVAARDDGFPEGAIGPAILDGFVLPWRPLDALVSSLPDPSEARIERDDLPDGGVEWQLEVEWNGAPLIQRWTIGPGGELRSWTLEREDRPVDPEGDFGDNITHAWLQFTISDDDPIEPPDVAAVPDAGAVGAPPDLPLAPPPASVDEIEQVAVCEHPSGRFRVALPSGWWTNRNGDDAGALWEACELFGPEPFAVTPWGDRTLPYGVALTIGWVDGGCIGSIWELLSSEATTVDGLPASVNEYALAGDVAGAFEYVIDLSEPGVDCEVGGRFIIAATNREMTGNYEANKAFLHQIMQSMEVTSP